MFHSFYFQGHNQNARQGEVKTLDNSSTDIFDWISAGNVRNDERSNGSLENTRDKEYVYKFSHRNVSSIDQHWCGNVSNTHAIDNLFKKRGWVRENNSPEISSKEKTTDKIDLEMIADLNKRKEAILPLDAEKIIRMRLASNATWTWIADFRPLSDKWMMSNYLDNFLKEERTMSQNLKKRQENRFHFRSWAVSVKSQDEITKRGQYTVHEVMKILKIEEQRISESTNHNDTKKKNDWTPEDGYYVKPGGAMAGGGRAVNFVKNLSELERYLHLWVKLKKNENKLGAVCLVQQAMSNRRRMVWHHMDGIPRFFEVRVMAVITGMDNDIIHVEQKDSSRIGLQDGSVHIFPKFRFKALPVPKSEKKVGPVLLNQRRQDMANNSAHTSKDKSKSKAEMFNSYSLEDFLESIPECEKNSSWISKTMLQQIISAIQDTAKACCFPRKVHANNKECKILKGLAKGAVIVNAFDFIIDTDGKPWLLEVNTKPWLRWAGVNTEVAYPHTLAREISAGLLEDFLRLIEDSKYLENICEKD